MVYFLFHPGWQSHSWRLRTERVESPVLSTLYSGQRILLQSKGYSVLCRVQRLKKRQKILESASSTRGLQSTP